MNLASKTNGIKETNLRYLSKEEEIEIRDNGWSQICVQETRKGKEECKHKNFYVVIQGCFPDGVETGERYSRNMIETNFVVLDYDEHGDWKTAWDKVKDHIEEYAIVKVQRSTRLGLQIIVKRIEGLTIAETIEFFEQLIGLKFDPAYKHNISLASYLMPSSEILYETDEYFEKRTNTNTALDTTEFLKAKREAEELAASTRTADAYPNFVSNSTFEKDLDLDRAEIRMIVDRCEKLGIDLCSSYIEWFRVAMALFNTLGSEGYEYFYRLSMLWLGGTPKEKEIQNMWKSIEKCAGKKITGKRITLATLISYARDAGVY